MSKNIIICSLAVGLAIQSYYSYMLSRESNEALKLVYTWKDIAMSWKANSDGFEKVANEAIRKLVSCNGLNGAPI